jgi:hypothetical protein
LSKKYFLDFLGEIAKIFKFFWGSKRVYFGAKNLHILKNISAKKRFFPELFLLSSYDSKTQHMPQGDLKSFFFEEEIF